MDFYEKLPKITPYIPENKQLDCAVVIFPGGAYTHLAPHEGKAYAEFLAANGITAFDVEYAVYPEKFPKQLFDARYAIKYVRDHADEYGIDRYKVAVMGSSAGGHLAALVSTYMNPIGAAEVDHIEDFLPDAQILCYPVIVNPLDKNYSHRGSYEALLGNKLQDMARNVDPSIAMIKDVVPQAFIWHTAEDTCVDVKNSLSYAAALHDIDVPVELHIFPDGDHGKGLAEMIPHTAQWSALLIKWLNRTFG